MKKIRPAKLKFLTGLLSFCLLLGLTACTTQISLVDVPEGLSPEQLFQKAQDALNLSEYDNARTFIYAFKDRYPDEKIKDLEADYLLAQISYKQGKLPEALAQYQALLARYDSDDAASYPQWPKILCIKLISKLEAKVPEAARIDPASLSKTVETTETEETTPAASDSSTDQTQAQNDPEIEAAANPETSDNSQASDTTLTEEE